MKNRGKIATAAFAAFLCATTLPACSGNDNTSTENKPTPEQPSGSAGTTFQRTNLVSDQAGIGKTTDPHLVNAWGLAFGPDTFFWVANNGTGTATVYNDEGVPSPADEPLVVQVGSAEEGPTGMVYNGSNAFMIQSGTMSGPSRFLFVTTSGEIWGWNYAVNETQAIRVLDSSDDAIYTGLALIENVNGQPMLYAADLHGAKVDVYDGAFNRTMVGAFMDPNLPQDYAPFGIAAINDTIYVAYAQQSEDKTEEEHGAGLGYVDAYSATGDFQRRIASADVLNAPWGMALAPDDFGSVGGSLLVGNFGDGKIHAYDIDSGKLLGALKNDAGKVIVVDGLWALAFGNGAQAGETDDLYVTAGPADETHGLFGEIAAGEEGSSVVLP